MDKQLFFEWWVANGKRGISFCECNYKEATHRKIREWLYEFNDKIPKPKTNKKKKTKILQLTDMHIPYHDKKTLQSVFNFIDDFKPDKIILTGDIFDFYKLSTFDKDPMRIRALQDEIDIGYPILKKISEKCKEIHFIKGNHEDRLMRYLKRNPELASIKVLELHKLLNLDVLGIAYHDFEYIYETVRFQHGQYVTQNSSKKELEMYGLSTTQGHTHRLESFYKTDRRGMVASYNMGCLCELTPEYITGIPNWQQCIGIFTFIGDRFHCQQIPIIKHKFVYGNKLYSYNMKGYNNNIDNLELTNDG